MTEQSRNCCKLKRCRKKIERDKGKNISIKSYRRRPRCNNHYKGERMKEYHFNHHACNQCKNPIYPFYKQPSKETDSMIHCAYPITITSKTKT